MTNSHLLLLRVGSLAMVLCCVACEDEKVSQPAVTPGASASGTAAASPTPNTNGSAKVKTRCEELNESLWEAVRDAPKACKKVEDCVIVGPGECVRDGAKKSCVAGIAKGYEEGIDTISKRWEAAGCDKTLPEVKGERLVCRAGNCEVVSSRK